MASLEEAQAQLRNAAQNLVLSALDEYGRLGCKLVSDKGQPHRNLDSRDAFVKAAYRKILLLVHPDKCQGSEKSHLATKALQAIWESRLGLSRFGWDLFCSRSFRFRLEDQFAEAEARVNSFKNAAGPQPAGGPSNFTGPAGAHASGSDGSTEGDAGRAAGSAEAPADPPGSTEGDAGRADEDLQGGRGDGLPAEADGPDALKRALNLDSVSSASTTSSVRSGCEPATSRADLCGGGGGEGGSRDAGAALQRHPAIPAPVAPSKKRKGSEAEDENKVRNSIIGKLPSALKQELRLDIHESLVGKSAFGFARLVRYICRKDLGLVEVDAVNSYFQMTVSYAFGIKREQAKRLFISLCFGGSLSNWCSEVMGYIPEEDDPMTGELMKTLQCFQTECRRLHRKIRRSFTPAQREWFKERSDASAAFSKYADLERKFLDTLIEAAGKQLVSGEHDGVCVFREASQRVLDAAVALKELPNPWTFASEEYSEFDWHVAARMPHRAFSELRNLVGRYRARGRCGPTPRTWCATCPQQAGREMQHHEYFTGQGFWVERHGEYMQRQIQEVLTQINRHPLAYTWTPPKPFNRVALPTAWCRASLAFWASARCPPWTARASTASSCAATATSWTSTGGRPEAPANQAFGSAKTLEENEKVDGVMTETIEMLYLWGGGSSGKDVLNLLIFAVLGLGPLLARVERKRAVWASEVPHHTHLNEDFVKPFCEQGGAPVPARRLNKAPRDFIPTSVLLATSNHPAQVERKSMTEDNGWDRRLRLLETKVKFTAKKEDLECNEMKADDNLKARVNLGHYNASLLFLVGELFPTLKPRFNEGTELVPKPACMEEAEKEFASKQSGSQFKQFVKGRCKRVEHKIDGSKFAESSTWADMNWSRALSCTPPLASATSSQFPPAGALFCVPRKSRATPVGAWLMTASSQKPPGSPSPVTAANFVFSSSPAVPPERCRYRYGLRRDGAVDEEGVIDQDPLNAALDGEPRRRRHGRLDPQAAFQERCLRIGMTPELYGKLKDKGYDTFGKIAFAAASSPQALTDEAIDVWLATVVDPRPSAFQVSVIRRLLFESQSLNIADLRTRVEGQPENTIKKLPTAERIARQEAQQARLKGVVFTVSNQPSHASIDQVTDMLENNSLRYLPMNRWTSRSQELSLAKKDSSIQIDAEGNLKLGTKVPDPVCDTNGAYALRQAFFRRSLALDLGNLCTFEVMEEWVNTIFELTQRQVPTGYTKVSLSQIVAADKELFIRAANNLEGKLQKPVGATKPLDAELKRLSVSHDITQFLSPLLTPPPPAHPTKRPQDGDDDAPPKKTKGKGDKGNKGGGKGKTPRIEIPEGVRKDFTSVGK
ncbi:unnamed protein product [Symbiodinium sp. CCMP2592]|nr:unnamed protein product [Symbiodinium sp. CCMP2592]